MFSKFQLEGKDGSSIMVSTKGATIYSWRNVEGKERLYISPLAFLNEEKPIRGGVPICFPQFGKNGSLMSHGFLRGSNFVLITSSNSSCHLQYKYSDISLSMYPYKFTLDYFISFSNSYLDLKMVVSNLDEKEMSFTCALHTYFKAILNDCHIVGLQNLNYINKLKNDEITKMSSSVWNIREMTDAIFPNVEKNLEFYNGYEHLIIEKDGFEDVVVWNPFIDGSSKIDDLQKDSYKDFLCIEAVQVNKPISLQPKSFWVGRQSIKIKE